MPVRSALALALLFGCAPADDPARAADPVRLHTAESPAEPSAADAGVLDVGAFWDEVQASMRAADPDAVLGHFAFPLTVDGQPMTEAEFRDSPYSAYFTDPSEPLHAALLATGPPESADGTYQFSAGAEHYDADDDFTYEYGVFGRVREVGGALKITEVGGVG